MRIAHGNIDLMALEETLVSNPSDLNNLAILKESSSKTLK
jgi:hypothetical protein